MSKIGEFCLKEVIQSLKIKMIEMQNYLISGWKFRLKVILLKAGDFKSHLTTTTKVHYPQCS